MKIAIKNNSPLIKVNFNFENESLNLEYRNSTAFNDYYDNQGSIGRIFDVKNSLNIDNDLILTARNYLNSGLSNEIFENDNLINLFSGIFESGEYEIFTQEVDIKNYDVVEPNENWYPFKMDSILITQFRKELSAKTLKRYENDLSDNVKPLILAVQYSFTSNLQTTETSLIILDGHHKFEAYRRKGLLPKFLIFYRKEVID